MDILDRIREYKLREVAERAAAVPEHALRRRIADLPPPRGFAAALQRGVAERGRALIAEFKRASPSRGVIRSDLNPEDVARAYAHAGAACLSVLTDGPSFQGSDADLIAARAAVSLPVLRKDFTFTPYQVLEARAIGADAVLLIVAALSDAQLHELEALALELGLDVLVETHDADEIARAATLRTPLIGINNRNLRTFAVDVTLATRLAPLVPADRCVIGESGYTGPADMDASGLNMFLIGEAMMRSLPA